MSRWCIIIEYMKGGSLRGLLLRTRDRAMNLSRDFSSIRDHTATLARIRREITTPVLDQNLILKYSREMISGLKYLHQNNIIHRDLRAANVLISAANTAKLGDFGLSRKLEAVTRVVGDYTPDVGNPFWRSPETMVNDECGPAVDVWSFGVTLLEMVWVDPPFMRQESFRYVYGLCKHRHVPQIPAFVDLRVQDILGMSLQYLPQDRPSSEEMLTCIEAMIAESKPPSSVLCDTSYES